jgi:regulator of RNase E activity RraA
MVPVSIGGAMVHPGDLLHGDCNGVVVVPNEIAADVAGLCGEYVAAEDLVLEYLQGGEVSVEGLKQARAESKRRITALVERVRTS